MKRKNRDKGRRREETKETEKERTQKVEKKKPKKNKKGKNRKQQHRSKDLVLICPIQQQKRENKRGDYTEKKQTKRNTTK
jgi:hypothetical protein